MEGKELIFRFILLIKYWKVGKSHYLLDVHLYKLLQIKSKNSIFIVKMKQFI